ncbi:MAG TPA: redoxin domain-containing protein [Planctomycetota bacterium]|nr:redoxin domain-containing protein [Planctomycetota bacterium]
MTANSPLAAGALAPELPLDDAAAQAARAAGAFVCFLPLAYAPVCGEDVRQLARVAAEVGAPRRPLLVVSVDAAEHGRRFLRDQDAGALTHVSDPQLALAAAFGVARREGICERATFLLAPDRRVVAGAVHPIGFPRPLALLREGLARSGLS